LPSVGFEPTRLKASTFEVDMSTVPS